MNKAVKILLSIFLVIAVCSCGDRYDGDHDGYRTPDVGGVSNGEKVNVPMNFFVEYDGDVDPYSDNGAQTVAKSATKAIVDVDENAINDVFVMQFNGTGDEAVLLYEPLFAAKDGFASIPLLTSAGECRLLVVANLGTRNVNWNFEPGITTYGEVRQYRKEIYSEFSAIVSGGIPMSGTWTGTIGTSSNQVNVGLTRNLAKIDIRITNNVPGLTITGVSLVSVPAFFDITAGQQIDAYADQVYPTAADDYFNYGEHTLSVASGANAAIQLYMPRNEQGRLSWTPEGNAKNNYASPDATYIRIRGELEGTTKLYSVYLGGADNYIVKPNTKYTHNVTFNDQGEPEVDSRVGDYYRIVSFKDRLANSYILNPPVKESKIEEIWYRVYPAHVNRFWGEDGYSFSSTTAINIGDTRYPWYAEILWRDYSYTVTTVGNTSFDNKNTSRVWLSDSPEGEEDYIEIRVPADAWECNFVVGIYRDRDGGTRKVKDVNEQYSWSWHFWVTDYNPDIAITTRPGVYDYNVPNGKVQRYEGEIWNEGIYKNAVIMDRNLGDESRWSIINRYKLYYQYGRKDPFPNSTPYGEGTTSISITTEASGPLASNGIKESIAKPTVMFIYSSGDWDNETEITPNFKLWKDQMIFGSMDELKTRTEKSIFDPCPYGWQLPHPDTWSDFNKGTTCYNEARGLGVYANWRYTLRYWPGTDYATSDVVYPYTGFKSTSTTVNTNYTSNSVVSFNVQVWTSVPSSGTHAKRFTSSVSNITSTSVAPAVNDGVRSLFLPVRCVKINN